MKGIYGLDFDSPVPNFFSSLNDDENNALAIVSNVFGIEVADEDLRVELFDSVLSLTAYIKTMLSALPCGRDKND